MSEHMHAAARRAAGAAMRLAGPRQARYTTERAAWQAIDGAYGRGQTLACHDCHAEILDEDGGPQVRRGYHEFVITCYSCADPGAGAYS